MLRAELLETLVARIGRLDLDHPVRVGIDGCDAAGKTTLAGELALAMSGLGRPVIRASLDGFHNPSGVRYRRGRESAEGYFLDSFDLDALGRVLLRPLGPNGSLMYQRAVFDFTTDRAVEPCVETSAPNAVLFFDGVFLHRNELNEFWDLSIFLEVEFETAIRRAEVRDLGLGGSPAEVRARYERRYMPGQSLYFRRCNPRQRASVVIENTEPRLPTVVDAA